MVSLLYLSEQKGFILVRAMTYDGSRVSCINYERMSYLFEDSAEDCAHDALLAVLAHLGDFRGESKFTTWVYQFGVNIARTRARQERWKHVSVPDLVGSRPPGS
jgi:hypothetical protein